MSSQAMQQKTPRASLWDLLGDLLMSVLQLLSQDDLNALSLVSKASRATSEPLPYQTIEWKWSEDQMSPIAVFLRTIMCRPELAAHVRSPALLGRSFFQAPFCGDRLPKVSTESLDLNDALKVIESTKVAFVHQ